MSPEQYQLMSALCLRSMIKEMRDTCDYKETKRRSSLRRSARLAMRRLGILMMRVGGKLVYLGTADEFSTDL
ncbi:MAG TPA: hypothetical protein VL461_12425 [Dictyobacter sp.]|jgi:hypothetical protein|nr:hypothetical protein [Dictyobacter sp.]